METSKIREYSNEELVPMLADEEKALKTLKYNSFINKVENPSKIKQMRKTIARIKLPEQFSSTDFVSFLT